jgi:hypothetical protein
MWSVRKRLNVDFNEPIRLADNGIGDQLVACERRTRRKVRLASDHDSLASRALTDAISFEAKRGRRG